MPSNELLDERDAYFNADTLISGQAELNKLKEMQEKYSAWKKTVFSLNDAVAGTPIHSEKEVRESVANFIEFCIKRIAHRETRYAFIDYLTKLNAEKITKLLNMLLDIDLAILSNSQAKKIFFVPRRAVVAVNVQPAGARGASTTVENRVPIAAPSHDASLQEVFVMPEIFRPLSENLEKKNPDANIAPLSPAMELFTSYQEWVGKGDNKKAVEELDKKLEPRVDFDSDVRRAAPIQQPVPAPARNPAVPTNVSVNNPIILSSPVGGGDLEEGGFATPYMRVSEDGNVPQRAPINAHHNMADLNLNTIRDFYTYEKVQHLPLSKAKQAEFLLWCDERMQGIFDYYESILSTEEDAENDKQSSDQLIFQNWRYYEYAKAFETAKANLADSTTVDFLTSLDSHIGFVNNKLKEAYNRLSNRTEQGHYFYKNFKDTAQDLYTQYLKLEHWKLQQAMLASPDNQYLDVMFSILSSKKDEVTPRSWYQFAWDMTQIPTMMGAVRVLAEFVVGKPDAEAIEVTHPQTPDELLNEKTLVRYDFYQPGSYSLSPVKTVFLNRTEDTLENLKQKLDGIIRLEGDSLEEISATLKDKPLTVKKTINVPRRAALSDAQQELFDICLTRNENALNNFIQKHGSLTTLSYFLTSFAYFGEIAYIATDYLLRAKALKPLLTAFGISNILDISGVEALYNSISTIAVTIANITFDPKSTAEGLLKEFFLNPENSLKTVGNSELKNNLSTLLGYWNVLVGNKIWEKPLLSLAFAGMAIGGASSETLALQALKELLGMSDAQFDAFFPPGASSLIFSGLAYYFFFNYKGIFNNTGKGIEKMKEILSKAFNEDSPRDRWAAGTVSTLLLLAIGERCFRMAYGPYITSMALGSSQTEAMMWATIVGASTLVTTPVTRVLNAASLVYADLSPEQWNLGLKSYMSLSAWQKWSPGLSDASMVLVGTCAYSLAKLVSLSFSGENLAANLLSTAVGLFTAYKFLQIFQASVRQKTITGLAQGSTFSFGQTAAWIAGIAVALDQLSRAVGGVTSLSTLLSFLNNDTPGNSLLLIVAFGAMAYIQKTVFDLQFPDVGATMQGYLNAVSETSVGRGFNGMVRSASEMTSTLRGYSTSGMFGSGLKAGETSTADYSLRAVPQERNNERGVELTASAPALGFSSSV